jgi:hypothetical protein
VADVSGTAVGDGDHLDDRETEAGAPGGVGFISAAEAMEGARNEVLGQSALFAANVQLDRVGIATRLDMQSRDDTRRESGLMQRGVERDSARGGSRGRIRRRA